MAATNPHPWDASAVGISGWNYAPWRGSFLSATVTNMHASLAFAAERFSTIEINGTFYSLQRPFQFSPLERTHPARLPLQRKRLALTSLTCCVCRNVEQALANFFSPPGCSSLDQKLGPILWQFPPNFAFNASLLEAFFQPPAPHHSRGPPESSANGTTIASRIAPAHRDRQKIAPCATPIEIRPRQAFLTGELHSSAAPLTASPSSAQTR